MLTITKEELIELGACNNGLARYVEQTQGTDSPIEIQSLIGGRNTVGDILWLAGKILPKERIVKFACQCALINIDMIKPYTDRYDEIVNFLKAPTQNAAADAADAAYAAYADADTAAARAAYAAYAAYAAADAADAAYAAYAARAAAYAARAARAAARADSTAKIEEFLKELFA